VTNRRRKVMASKKKIDMSNIKEEVMNKKREVRMDMNEKKKGRIRETKKT
jgi:hypothetical protein